MPCLTLLLMMDSMLNRLWRGRSRKGKALVIGGAVLLLFALIGALAPAEEASDDEPPAAQTSSPPPPPPPPPKPPPPEPPPPPATDEDTGRMSEGEYEQWTGAVEDLNDESLEWSQGAQTCSVIGQSGDLAGFRDCIKEEYKGFENSVYFARDTTDGLMESASRR